MYSGQLFHRNANGSPRDREVSGWKRLWDARFATIFVFLFRFAFALSLAWPFADRLDSSSHRHLNTVQTQAGQNVLLSIESLRQSLPTIHDWSLMAIGITLLYLLLVPLISMTWIHAIDDPCYLRTSVIMAARFYHASLLISLIYLFAMVTSIAIFLGLGWSLHRCLYFLRDDRMRDIFSCIIVIPASLSISYIVVSVDMARISLYRFHRISSAMRLGLSAAFRLESILAYLFWFGWAALFTSGSVLFLFFKANGFIQSFFSSFILLESVAFARILFRGRWLVTARDIVYRIDKRRLDNLPPSRRLA